MQRCRSFLWLPVALLGLLAPPAHATLIGDSATVTLTDGGSLDVSDTVSVGAGPELTPGDGSNIGALLLPNEAIDLDAFTIVLRLEEGASDGTTGYPAGTRYVLSGLDFGPSLSLVDVSVVLDNVTGVALGSELTFGGHFVSLAIDSLVIGDLPNAVDVGSVTLTLEVAAPEPGAWLLLAGAALIARRRRGRRAA